MGIAVEEAFTVYDHPPVWVFRKQDGFSMENARGFLGGIDLTQVIFQAPHDTKVFEIK